MDWHNYVRAALSRHQPSPDSDVVEELAQHAAASFATARSEGRSAEDANARVRGLVDRWCADAVVARRRPRRRPAVETPAATARSWIGVIQEVRYGVRLLGRQPGFALLATLLIALGVGAATTLASLTYGVLLKPLAWPDADRLVLLAETREGANRSFPNIFTNATYLAWRETPATLDSIAGYITRDVTITGDGEPERLKIVASTASLFTVLRTRALQGRVFSADDEVTGRNHVIVLSYGLWQRRMAGMPSAIGGTIELDGDRYQVVAVMPKDFAFPTRAVAAWIPQFVPPVIGADPQARSVSLFRAVARLKPGITAAQATAEGTARGRAAPDLGMVGTAVFGTQGKPHITVAPYIESLTADVRPALYMLLAAVALLLAAAVANVAGMQLARATTRRREVAIRAALGAGTGRIARQFLTENLLIGLAGGVAGWIVALGLHRALPRLLPADFPRADEALADWRLFVCSAGIALMASLTFGVLPALVARRINLVETLTEDSVAPIGGNLRSRLGRMRVVIMACQVAIAAVLLVGAALLGRSFVALLHADRGYDPRNLLTATLPLPDRRFTGTQRAALLDAVLERVVHAPGVTAAAAASIMPLLPYDQPMSFQLPPGHGQTDPIPVQANLRSISPGYFAALGMQMLEGRDFSNSDTMQSLPVIIVNRAFAKKYLVSDAIGVRLPLCFGSDCGNIEKFEEIVGVVDDVRQRSATDTLLPEIYSTYRQHRDGMDMPTPVLVLRTAGDPAQMAGTLRAIVHDQNSTVALDSVMTMDERLLTSLARPRLYAALLGAFAGFALLVAGAGLFSVLSYNVAQRSREIGVRAALGATPINIVGLILRQGLAITIAGLAIGLGVAFALVKYLSTLLYGVATHDVFSFVAVPIALVIVAGIACFVPARRAARIDPLRAMRSN